MDLAVKHNRKHAGMQVELKDEQWDNEKLMINAVQSHLPSNARVICHSENGACWAELGDESGRGATEQTKTTQFSRFIHVQR